MAIYHLHMKVIGRSSGASAVAAAAYRSASRLRDDRIERSHDFTAKRGVVHSEVLLPEGAPDALSDREQLWNAVEACEVRRDAQLARELEFALPREMTVNRHTKAVHPKHLEQSVAKIHVACLVLQRGLFVLSRHDAAHWPS